MPGESTGAIARTKSPNSVEGWHSNTAPLPMSNAVPVLPAKPSNANDLDAWSGKPDLTWNGKPPQQQSTVPDPWNIKGDAASSLDPWAPVSDKSNISGVKLFCKFL